MYVCTRHFITNRLFYGYVWSAIVSYLNSLPSRFRHPANANSAAPQGWERRVVTRQSAVDVSKQRRLPVGHPRHGHRFRFLALPHTWQR